MLRLKEKINNLISQKNIAISILLKEIKVMKEDNLKKDKKIKIDNKNNINSINIINNKKDAMNKLNTFLLVGEDILKIIENKNTLFEQIFNKLSYKSYKNYYNNVLKYYDLINNDFSKSKIDENLISCILPQNSIDINETNLSNIYFDVLNTGNNKSKIEDLSSIFNSKFC